MGEAKRRQETGAPPPRKQKDRKPLYAGLGVIVLVFVAVGVFFLTASPSPTSDELPVAAPNADPFPAELDRYGVSIGDDACGRAGVCGLPVPGLCPLFRRHPAVEAGVCRLWQGALCVL